MKKKPTIVKRKNCRRKKNIRPSNSSWVGQNNVDIHLDRSSRAGGYSIFVGASNWVGGSVAVWLCCIARRIQDESQARLSLWSSVGVSRYRWNRRALSSVWTVNDVVRVLETNTTKWRSSSRGDEQRTTNQATSYSPIFSWRALAGFRLDWLFHYACSTIDVPKGGKTRPRAHRVLFICI